MLAGIAIDQIQLACFNVGRLGFPHVVKYLWQNHGSVVSTIDVIALLTHFHNSKATVKITMSICFTVLKFGRLEPLCGIPSLC